MIESGQPKLNIEELQTLPNGVNITLLTSKVPLFDCHGNVTGVLGVYTDITERKKLEENLKLAKERAEQGNQAKNEFLENMRHDIRTPLTGIIGCAQLVQSQSNKPEKVAEYASDLIASSNALLDFLNKVLETIEVSTGKMPLLKKKFDLYQVLKSVIHLNKAQATAKNLELYLDYDKKLPAYMIGDPMRVQRIILELIVNALKFTNKGKVSVNASLIRETEKIIVKLAVSDTGIGISEENYQNIYTRFKRLVPSYQGVYPGTGLGLSVVKQFIEDLDAEIYLESQLQQGSTFTCLIPFQRPLLMDEDGLDEEITYSFEKILSFQAHKEDVITDKPANKMLSIGTRVLVVEDQIIAAKIAQRILLELHCQVDIASNKKKALDYIKKNRYDLILMDVGLQDEDGEEVTRCIRKDLSIFTPIIGLTAHVGTEKKHSCLVAGMDAIFVKPFTFEKASKILNAFIPGKRQNFLTQAVKDNIKETELLTILDIDRAIQLMGNKDFVKENLSLLVKNLSENLETLQQCYQNKDWQAIKGIAHKWMGGAIYCGARRLEKACQKFSISLQRETEQIEKFYQQLLQAAKATKELVINILSSQII
ncbi:MAG: ATP-binding protein [Rickettsiella sp.]|nr:ATP-binding protein [Rickettsiella sp.]